MTEESSHDYTRLTLIEHLRACSRCGGVVSSTNLTGHDAFHKVVENLERQMRVILSRFGPIL